MMNIEQAGKMVACDRQLSGLSYHFNSSQKFSCEPDKQKSIGKTTPTIAAPATISTARYAPPHPCPHCANGAAPDFDHEINDANHP